MSNTTRRSLLVGALLSPIVSKVALAEPRLHDGEATEQMMRLQCRRDYLIGEIRKLDDQWRIANELLPAWCQLGLKYQDEDGRPFGPMVGWPETRVRRIRINGTQWLVRPSPFDLRKLFGEEIASLGEDAAGTNYRVRIRQIRDRLRQRREVYQSVGLPTSYDWLPLDVELEEVEAALSSLLTGEQLVSQFGQRSSQVADHSSVHLVPHGHS